MKFITNIEEFAGKTIQAATFVDADESVAIIFNDNTCAYFDVKFYGDSHELELVKDTDVYDSDKAEAGIITDAEYQKRKRQRALVQNNRTEQIERAQLKKLLDKYGS